MSNDKRTGREEKRANDDQINPEEIQIRTFRELRTDSYAGDKGQQGYTETQLIGKMRKTESINRK